MVEMEGWCSARRVLRGPLTYTEVLRATQSPCVGEGAQRTYGEVEGARTLCFGVACARLLSVFARGAGGVVEGGWVSKNRVMSVESWGKLC